MALNNNALLHPANGRVLIGTVGTAVMPSQTAIDAFVTSGTAITGFSDIGYTSSETLPDFTQDGGDITSYNTWQASGVKTSVEAITNTVVVAVNQLDEVTLPLYYGGGTVIDGSYAAPVTPVTQSRALLIIFIGSRNVAFYAYQAAVIRSDAPSLSTDSLAEFPLGFTIETVAGHAPFNWISPEINA